MIKISVLKDESEIMAVDDIGDVQVTERMMTSRVVEVYLACRLLQLPSWILTSIVLYAKQEWSHVTHHSDNVPDAV